MSDQPKQSTVEILRIVQYPHPALRAVAEPIMSITEEVKNIAGQMRRLLLEHRGFGLAANQVGHPIRMFVAKDPSGIVCTYINPEITFRSTEPERTEPEGCLSWEHTEANGRRMDEREGLE